MSENGATPQLPRTRREFRDWLHKAGFPKRLCEKLAAHFPENENAENEEDESDLAELHSSIDQLKKSFME